MDFFPAFLLDLIVSRIIAVRPVLRFGKNQLFITSDWRTLLMSLGAWRRKITVDAHLKVVKINQRTFWFFIKQRRLEFEWMAEILYGYQDQAPFGDWSSHQSIDMYTISLLLKNGEIVKLCRFFGQGDFVYNGVYPDWFYWADNLEANMTKVDHSGSSLSLVDLLERMIGIPVSNPDMALL